MLDNQSSEVNKMSL